jgi:hypothetical protein
VRRSRCNQRSGVPMKMAGVATIDSFRESIVGFQKVTNAHGYREERSNRGYPKPHYQKSRKLPSKGGVPPVSS